MTETEQFFRVSSDDRPDIINPSPLLTFWVVIGLTMFIVSVGIGDGDNTLEFWLNNN